MELSVPMSLQTTSQSFPRRDAQKTHCIKILEKTRVQAPVLVGYRSFSYGI